MARRCTRQFTAYDNENHALIIYQYTEVVRVISKINRAKKPRSRKWLETEDGEDVYEVSKGRYVVLDTAQILWSNEWPVFSADPLRG